MNKNNAFENMNASLAPFVQNVKVFPLRITFSVAE